MDRRSRRTQDPRFACRFLFEALVRRHRQSAVVLVDATGEPLLGVTGTAEGEGFAVHAMARAQGRALADETHHFFERLGDEPVRYDPRGERVFVSPVHISGRRFFIVSVGGERGHLAVVAEATLRLLVILGEP
ncbi:MAG: hypothetical protein KC549_02475 [Myxococcales bacterium]|nr:hypothetical protein [Myxococcales bacterium]MCB9546559.1 hypothetical protein [Myxococcales bacterium]